MQLTPSGELKSIADGAIGLYFKTFGYKEFTMHQSQSLPSFVMLNAYRAEEEFFLKIVQKCHVSNVPTSANVIKSHVIYKVKNLMMDRTSWKLELRRMETVTKPQRA